MKKHIISFIAIIAALCGLCACTEDGVPAAWELSKDYERTASVEDTYNYSDGAVEPPSAYNNYAQLITNFELKLFRMHYAAAAERNETEGFMMSPVGTALNLSLLTNGAAKGTAQDLQLALGLGLDDEMLNQCSSYFKSRLLAVNSVGLGKTDELSGKKAEGDPNVFLTLDNVYMIDDETDVRTPFLTLNANYYGADIFRFPFGDDNAFEKLSARYDCALDSGSVEPNTLRLFSRLRLGDYWLGGYSAENIKKGDFTGSDGKTGKAVYLCSEESYVHTDAAQGVLKYTMKNPLKLLYIMPKDEEIDSYIAHFDSVELSALLDSVNITEKIPVQLPETVCKNTTDGVCLDPAVKSCGLSSLYTDKANFSSMAHTEGLRLNDVCDYSGCLSLTASGITTGTPISQSVPSAETDKDVLTLDHPFMIAVLDNESNIPICICVKNC